MSNSLTQTFPPTAMARCPVCHKAIGPGNARTSIQVRVLEEHEPPIDGAIVLQCPRSTCRRKLETRPIVQQSAAA